MSTITVDKSLVSQTGLFDFATEASTLRLPCWVARILIPGLGNGAPFIRQEIISDPVENETLYADYSQINGCLKLRVFND